MSVKTRRLLLSNSSRNVWSFWNSPYFSRQYPVIANFSTKAESFLSGTNANFLETQYVDWRKSKGTIDSSWDTFYDSVTSPALKIEEYDDFSPRIVKQRKGDRKGKISKKDMNKIIKLNLAVQNLIRSYQTRGHLLAKIDPLGLSVSAHFILKNKPKSEKVLKKEHGVEYAIVARELQNALRQEHMDMEFELPERTFIGGTETKLKLREIIKRLKIAYCGPIGVEYMHMYDVDCVTFVRKRMEWPGPYIKTVDEKKIIMQRLTKAVYLEKYFAAKWPAEKRFGLEGGESMIVMLEEIVDHATRMGVEYILLGMPHRGRLNVLVNVCRKQLVEIFAQFRNIKPETPGSGDIKYHLGTTIHRFLQRTHKYVRVGLSANPSHLEVVTPVVTGKARAEQYWRGDSNGDQVMAVIIHGDASMAGQGVVYETVHLSHLPAFTAHGCVHVVCNNQIGYTTDPRFARSSPYCSDVAKCTDAPVFHVNGDEPEAVSYVSRLAVEYRCKFKKDVVLDLVCYRRYGHSETDEPMFTQPFMYKKIASLKTADQIYAEKLKAQGDITEDEIRVFQKEYLATMNRHYDMSKKLVRLQIEDWIDTPWIGFFEGRDRNKIHETGISEATINRITKHFCAPPPKVDEFEIHPGIQRILDNREALVKSGFADWAIGEAIAYGSLLRDKVHIRFTGEDVERGTMAHRHHVYHHQSVDGAMYRVLDTIYADQQKYHIFNSSLSEFAILAFELGYSLSSPNLVTIWESQYGDFADNAQTVFDTFIANAQSKWICQSGLVVQLPHGIEGAGPEHSSGRPERYLLQCDDDEDVIPDLDDPNLILNQLRLANWFVCNVTTPANYFHLIRRQVALPFRKPLILFTPKVGLKHPYYRSPFKDFMKGTKFQRAIRENGPASRNPEKVEKLIFCSGSVAITIDDVRRQSKLEDKIAMCRIEQLYPFPYDIVLDEFCRYSQANVAFCQEEHKNQGPWPFCKVRLENLFERKIECISRPPSPASATGIKWIHYKELKDLRDKIIKL